MRTNRTLKCWGANNLGQLGDGTTIDRHSPTSNSIINVVAVGGGDLFTVARNTAGGIRTWGANNFGQLGSGTTTNRLTPGLVTGLN